MSNLRIATAVAALLIAAAPVWAQEKAQGQGKKGAPAAEKKSPHAKGPPSEAQMKRQERMRFCNEAAATRKLEGDERRHFMRACLRGADPVQAERRAAQGQKMRNCNRQATEKGLKGEERRAFMSECLRG